ncbi:hypothetical protein Tco_0736851 [Tanacetum coccineum]
MANPDDEPMWAADCVVATIPATANEFTIECNHLTLVKGNQFDGRIKTDPHKHIHDFLGVCDMFKYRATDNEAVRLMMFPLSLTGEAKTCLTKGNIIKIFSHGLNETTQEALNVIDGGIFLYKTLNQAYQLIKDKVLLKLDWAKNQKPKALVRKTKAFANKGSNNSDTDKIMTRMDVMTMKMDAQYKEISYRMQSLRSIDVIDEILEEYFDALLDEESKIIYSIEGTPLEDKIFAKFDELIAMNIEENTKLEINEEITFDTDYKIKKSLEEPPTDLELKPLLDHLEYAFLEETSLLLVIISSQLFEQNKNKLIYVLKRHKQDFA